MIPALKMTVFDLQNHFHRIPPTSLAPAHTAIALGTFDGVHIGHAALLRRAVALCETSDGTVFPAVWTFSDAPYTGTAPVLSPLSDKLRLFAAHGIRYAFLEDFPAVRNTTPTAFVNETLLSACRAVSVVCGFNFRFGHNAAGTPSLLDTQLTAHGATLSVIDPVTLDGTPVSSTRIRMCLATGDTVSAARCLGRYFSFSLPVVHGKELGRTLGVPTINQNIPPKMQIPLSGTYATAVSVDGVLYPAVTNIGIRPSIHENDNHIPNAETHIIGYRGWLYDKSIRVFFRRRLRPEQKFETVDALKAQIHADIRASLDSFEPTQKEWYCDT